MSQSLSISLVQQQFPIGAVRQNVLRVIELAAEAATDLVVFPELTLTGYPPEDLLYRDDLLQLVEAGLADIQAAAYPGVLVIGHPWREHGVLYNAASVIQNGKLIGHVGELHPQWRQSWQSGRTAGPLSPLMGRMRI